MSISLNFANYQNYSISESRAEKLIERDRNDATKLTLWDSIKDFFRSEKKKDALNALYTLINDNDGYKNAHDKMIAFHKLNSFAHSAYQNCFTQKLVDSDVIFLINQQPIGHCKLNDLMYLSQKAQPVTLVGEEERVFMAMLNTLHTQQALYPEASSDMLRQEVGSQHCADLYSLYRPNEDRFAAEEVEFNAEILSEDEENLLEDLNQTEFLGDQHFVRIGYNELHNNVSFSMVHPSISYLIDIFHTNENISPNETNKNDGLLNILNADYDNYISHKSDYDTLLTKIYYNHGGTLNTETTTGDSNKLLFSPSLDHTTNASADVSHQDRPLHDEASIV